MKFDRKRQEEVRRVLGEPDLYPTELISYIIKKLSDNPAFEVAEVQLPSVELPRTVGATGEPAFGANWSAYDAIHIPQFFKDPWGIVHLSGLAKRTVAGANGTVIYTLPAGYRPQVTRFHGALGGGNIFVRVDVGANGDVIYWGSDAGAAYVQLDALTFRAYS